MDRIHLVIDGERNDWSDELFFSLAPKANFRLKEEISKEDTLRIIEELRMSNLPAAAELIKKMEDGSKIYFLGLGKEGNPVDTP